MRVRLLKRVIDLCGSAILLIVLLIPMVVIALMVKLTSEGPVLYWSDRVGCTLMNNNFRLSMNNRGSGKTFTMPKFRTMLVDAPVVATHLLDNPDDFLSPIGGFLRKNSLDELPQLWSILKGDMSFVGPRPALFNQDDLILLRTEQGVDRLVPGITGWAQINGRDELTIPEKVALDVEYLQRQSFWFDLNILWKTFLKVVKHDGVSH